MDFFFKIKINLVFLLFVFSLTSCAKNKDDNYEILSRWLAPEIKTKLAHVNLVYHVLKQTHEPLFRRDDGENFTSKVLKKWSRSIDYKEYNFCPNTTLIFNDKARFDKSFFLNYIIETTKKFDKDFKVTEENDCFKIKFSKQQKNYLDFLTWYENAPTLQRTENVEDGLGEFYVDKIENDKMILKRKKNIHNAFSKITIYKINSDKNIPTKNIEDFNFFNPEDIPEEIRKKYTKVNILDLKSVVLIINHPDNKIRQCLYNCIDTDELLHSFYYNKKFWFIPIASILPIGISGAQKGRPLQICKTNKRKFRNVEVVFGNWFSEINQDAMLKFSENFYNKTGIRIKIKKITVEELISRKKPKSYNLTIIVLDATRNDPLAFFEVFGDFQKSEHNLRIQEIEKIYNSLSCVTDEKEKSLLYDKMIKIIKDKHLVLPLCQTIKTMYYPPCIKNITVGCGFLQYPEVAEFRW